MDCHTEDIIKNEGGKYYYTLTHVWGASTCTTRGAGISNMDWFITLLLRALLLPKRTPSLRVWISTCLATKVNSCKKSETEIRQSKLASTCRFCLPKHNRIKDSFNWNSVIWLFISGHTFLQRFSDVITQKFVWDLVRFWEESVRFRILGFIRYTARKSKKKSLRWKSPACIKERLSTISAHTSQSPTRNEKEGKQQRRMRIQQVVSHAFRSAPSPPEASRSTSNPPIRSTIITVTVVKVYFVSCFCDLV